MALSRLRQTEKRFLIVTLGMRNVNLDAFHVNSHCKDHSVGLCFTATMRPSRHDQSTTSFHFPIPEIDRALPCRREGGTF